MRTSVIDDIGDLKVKETKSGSGSLPPITGKLKYDKGFSASGYYSDRGDYFREGQAAKAGAAFGMPFKINGHPLGCGCSEAYIHAIGEIRDGMIEADYMCDSGWHNFVVFELEEMGKQQGLVVDKNGNLVETQDVGHGDQELQEY